MHNPPDDRLEPSAQAISNQIGTVQKAVTDRQRRWYEVF